MSFERAFEDSQIWAATDRLYTSTAAAASLPPTAKIA